MNSLRTIYKVPLEANIFFLNIHKLKEIHILLLIIQLLKILWRKQKYFENRWMYFKFIEII